MEKTYVERLIMLNILTLNYNKCDNLCALHETMRTQELDTGSWTWFIKDNFSKDSSYEEAKNHFKNTVAINYKNNLQNYSEGNNYLFNIAAPPDNDFILLLNNDILFNDRVSIGKMISLLKDDVGVVGAKLLYTNKKRIQHAGVIFPNHGLPLNHRRGDMDDVDASKNRYFQAITGAVMLMRAETYKNICKTNKSGINGLDENFVWCFDDVDACLSIKYNQNKKIVYCGETNISHEESLTLKTNPVNKLFMTHNVNIFQKKWKGKYINDLDRYTNDHNYNLIK